MRLFSPDNRTASQRPKLWTTPAHVYGDIQNFSVSNAHEFSLRMLYLIMQSPQNIAGGAGMIILHKPLIDSHIRHGLLVIALKEKPPLVAEYPRFEDEHSGSDVEIFLSTSITERTS